ncbi:MAG: response regulator [Candidatus Sericytochromatia bacterium]|nr:response regulator [Candidatus Sericytochromatia bacterium]
MSLALSRQVTILLVDDNEIDREAVRRAFARQKIANPIIEAEDGIEALRILRGQAHSPRPPRPLLILLDINMPRMNGVEFLRELRGDDLLRDCIVFVLTTSNSEEDIMAAYDFNVAGYLVKNDVGNGFVKLIDLLDSFWRIVEFPMGRMT